LLDGGDLTDLYVTNGGGPLQPVVNSLQPPPIFFPGADIVYEKMCEGGKGTKGLASPRHGPYIHVKVTFHVLLQC
jgi:hypothetical protein